ncbi:RecBCD enzyme subunit RecC [Thalassotalea profundi]|uniref:RecBCD enzyme subunit RecC n=2 Tax=Thalassotalea profundi TaxID=2036687 RepID=A0ABQ3IVH7_9GAMM|nr:RecBCD enzyme subunit RecC [Thalassotalea profundi]
MENLLALLDKVHQVSPLPVFAKEVIIVQNAGMQHWLNMSLAQSRQISLANEFLLPAQFLWQLMRSLASAEKVPEQSPYSREALCWRIYQELAHEDIIDNVIYQQVTRYWLRCDDSRYSDQELKRYQLACQLADLYEQYLIFRPQWINNWYQGKGLDNESDSLQESLDNNFEQLSTWQADLWLRLTKETPYNPLELMQSAIDNIADNLHLLPQRISFFGINAMAPMWLEFINAISEHTQVHFFHLNPCFNYWGDIKTQKQALQHMTQWTEGYDDIAKLIGNPILANLGQQGREFLALLQQYSTVDIDVYQSFLNQKKHVFDDINIEQSHSVLSQIQEDILTLSDSSQLTNQKVHQVDDSIVFTSAHSALREVQGLHDWLLHQFNTDNSLTPKDILVMCPQVEEYAPYIQAVFANGWQDLSGDIPPLPCSISDRVSKESNPLVIAFSEIVSLPDSRFSVSQILSWLRIPAIQSKFGFSLEDLEKCSQWLNEACVHWGLNQSHKQQLLNSETISGQFTWQFGFTKLLQGFAYADEECLYHDHVLLANVEGNDALVLGNLMLFIEQLQLFSASLSQAKTPQQWHQYLTSLLEQLFDVTNESADESGFVAIHNAIESLVEYCEHAQFSEALGLNIIKEFLNNHFSQPDAGRQFMVGQVTFCSMLPMRSIPFKIIAVLGLNDGEFPRQRQPLGFDLMSMQRSEIGDRSRRGDDKYLFLEAIISARKALYLSFQGRNIKKNTPKEPSVVLKELMNYLTAAFGWDFDNSDERHGLNQIRQLPMQAFSLRNFVGEYASFDPHWLSLGQVLVKSAEEARFNESNNDRNASFNSEDSRYNKLPVIAFNDTELSLSVADLIAFYHHPAKYFAKRRLNLYLAHDSVELSDVEPFTASRLESYLFNQELLTHHLYDEPDALDANLEQSMLFAKVSGKFPELPTMEIEYKKWLENSRTLADAIHQSSANQSTESLDYVAGELKLPIVLPNRPMINVTLHYQLPVKADNCLFYRSSSAKIKDKLSLYIHQLVLQMVKTSTSEHQLSHVIATKGFYFNTKSQKVEQFKCQDIKEPGRSLDVLLRTFIEGLERPLLLNGELAEFITKTKNLEQTVLESFWNSSNNNFCLGNDPYMNYFWPEYPELTNITEPLMSVYEPIFTQLTQVRK